MKRRAKAMELESSEDRFIYNLCEMLDLLTELTQDCQQAGVNFIPPGLLSLAKNMLGGYDKTYIVDNFILNTEEYWDQIQKRNVDFFIKNGGSLLKNLPIANVNFFKIFFTNDTSFTVDDREAIWVYFSTLVRISINYIHEKRKCVYMETPQGLVPKYTCNFMTHIKVGKHASTWNMDLHEKMTNH